MKFSLPVPFPHRVSKPSISFLTFLPKTNQRRSWFAQRFFQVANYDRLNQKCMQGVQGDGGWQPRPIKGGSFGYCVLH
jgi:hypothetical protein